MVTTNQWWSSASFLLSLTWSTFYTNSNMAEDLPSEYDAIILGTGLNVYTSKLHFECISLLSKLWTLFTAVIVICIVLEFLLSWPIFINKFIKKMVSSNDFPFLINHLETFMSLQIWMLIVEYDIEVNHEWYCVYIRTTRICCCCSSFKDWV